MKQFLILLFIAACSAAALASEPLSLGDQITPLSTVPVTRLETLDREALLAEDAQREAQPGIAPRFAVPHPVNINAATAGRWETA
jgi:hypothetical protein